MLIWARLLRLAGDRTDVALGHAERERSRPPHPGDTRCGRDSHPSHATGDSRGRPGTPAGGQGTGGPARGDSNRGATWPPVYTCGVNRRLLGCAAAFAALAVACQPADDNPLDEPADAGVEVPDGLDELEGMAAEVVEDWDASAVLTEVQAELADDGEVEAGRLTYTGPGSATVLLVDVGPDAVTSSTATLETLGLEPVPAEALADVPALDAPDPVEVAAEAGPALAECGHGSPREVRYTSGAPEAWDGSRWRAELVWAVNVLGDGGGVVYGDPAAVGSDDATCVDIPPEDD